MSAPGLRAMLDAAFTELPPRLERLADPESGVAACLAISDLYDREIRTRFEAAVADAAAGGTAIPLALVATGGWARRELAPYSDIDFIVLHGEHGQAFAKQVADRLLYPLWDERLAIGHAVREPSTVADLARGDLATATALLDARHVAGDRGLTAELVRETHEALAPDGNPNELIAALAGEQRGRHHRFGASLYLLEPDLKHGIGALRDLSTALWVAAIRWYPRPPDRDPPSAGEVIEHLVERGHLTTRQAAVLTGARDFLLRVRTLVQLAARRRFDQLTFEIQETIAPKLYPDARPVPGDIRPAVAPAVEALMRDYYLHARGLVNVTDRVLESARVSVRHTPVIADIDDTLITIDGALAIRDRAILERPAELVRLFRVAVQRGLEIDGHTGELIAEKLSREGAGSLAGDRDVGRLVLEALCDLDDVGQPGVFDLMHQLGILSAVMPEWAPCTARVQHDLYHVYTVDQHQLYAVAMQKRLARGELASEHPTATELCREVTRPAPLLLATLLHDVGKPLGKGHAEKGAVVTRRIAERLGMSTEDAELAEFLVRQHLTMSHLSQRRDLSDPDVIERFAKLTGDEEHLIQLYLLTLCDTAMTAPDNLTAWKAGLLRELVIRTRAFFREGVGTDDRVPPPPALRAHVIALAGAEVEPIIDAIDPRLFVQLTPGQAADCTLLIARSIAARDVQPVDLAVRTYEGHTEAAIVAPDQPGVLAAVAGALIANRIDVLGAQLGHVDLERGRLVLDVFYVRDLKGQPIPDDDPRWTRLRGDLRALLQGDRAPDPDAIAALIARRRPPSGMPRRVTPGVVTEIKLHDDSTVATIVEVATLDRVGVLHAITQVLAELGLDISLAKVATEGEKVADVFYVTRGGERLTDPGERAALVARLEAAVGQVPS